MKKTKKRKMRIQLRPIGMWIHRIEEDWAGDGVTYCSSCNYGYADDAFHEVERFNYCPHCGVRMRKR